jgi:hypothetical protein
VAPIDVVGKIVAVFADGRANARRVDNLTFARQGRWIARTRRLRALGVEFARLCRVFVPWLRSRGYAALVEAMSSVEQRDAARLEGALAAVDADSLSRTARRHRCAALLLQGMHELAVTAHHDELAQLLQPVGRATVMQAFALRDQIADVCRSLKAARIRFALLKGAARLYAGDPEADLHPSVDIDVLVDREQLDAAGVAMSASGYASRVSASRAAAYRAFHHHAAPLYPSSRGVPVELHTALGPSDGANPLLDWNELSPHLRAVDGPAGPVLCLDAFATALHLAIHSASLRRLRDTVVLAKLLAAADRPTLTALAEFAARRFADSIRVQASLALAADVAGIQMATLPEAARYVGWVFKREDLPQYIRDRCQFLDAWHAAGARIRSLKSAFARPALDWSRSPTLVAAYRFTGRMAAAICALGYACMLPSPRRGHVSQ